MPLSRCSKRGDGYYHRKRMGRRVATTVLCLLVFSCCFFIPSAGASLALLAPPSYRHVRGIMQPKHQRQHRHLQQRFTTKFFSAAAAAPSPDDNNDRDSEKDDDDDEAARWEATYELKSNQFGSRPEMKEYLDSLRYNAESQYSGSNQGGAAAMIEPFDPLWEQVKLEATASLSTNPEAGPLLYTCILSQKSLLEAVVAVVSHQIGDELIPATALKNLFLEQLTNEDSRSISFDLVAACTRSASVENAMAAVAFHQGFHALVCYRLGHRLWLAGRKGLAYYLQSTISRRYSADIHPAAVMGVGIHMRATAGVVIGETAVLGNDVSILEGVTLGGTGKESGDRHPKLSDGVTVQHGASILGNIRIGEGAIITSKSIVTKPVPPLAIFSGVPAKFQRYRTLSPNDFKSDMQRHLAAKYLERWKKIADETNRATEI